MVRVFRGGAVGLLCTLVIGGFAGAAQPSATSSRAAADARIGVAEDETKYAADGGTALFARMKGYGLISNRVSVYWDFQHPATIFEKPFLDRLVPAANAAGVQLVFAIFADARIAGAARAISQGGAAAFCDYAALVARTYPSVTKIIIGNEPNQPRFWQPQFGAGGEPLSPGDYEAVLARCYDALKAVNPAIDVIGVGLSPRGNDSPNAPSNVSISPVRFIYALAAAYRASGRTLPLMDEFAFHCYPNVNTDPLEKGYRWPNIGCVNLDRLKQALWDGFNGTGQPTPLETGVALAKVLTIVLDETGWQVDVSGRAGYTGTENVPPVDEATQAAIYAGLVRIALCDPAITALHILYLLDAPELADFQSGILRVDGSERPSAAAVRDAIAAGCSNPTSWRHSTVVAGAAFQSLAKRPAVVVTATEDYAYELTVARGGRSAKLTGTGKAYFGVPVVVPRAFLGGRATVTLRAWANPARTSRFSFVVGTASRRVSSGPPPPPPTGVATGTVLVNGQPFSGGVIPYGSTVDVTDGTVELHTDIGDLSVFGADGVPSRFRLVRPSPSLVELRLVGDFSACNRVLAGVSAKRKPVRLVWAKGKGKFRSKGRDSTASVRGTYWLTEDRCDGTLTTVKEGVVTVRDLRRRKTVNVPAGHSYLALHKPKGR